MLGGGNILPRNATTNKQKLWLWTLFSCILYEWAVFSPTTTLSKKKGVMSKALDSFFGISSRGSSIGTEIRAGISSFLTVSYVILVNPQIMSQAGLSSSTVVFSTCLSSALSTILVGVVGNLPLALSPGMGLSAYLTYGLVLSNLLTLKEATTSVAIAGLLQLLLACTGATKIVMRLVPKNVKVGIVVGMGVLVAMIGMVSVGIVVANDKTLVGLGDIWGFKGLVSIGGVVLIGSLVHHGVRGGILLGIAALTCFCWTVEGGVPEKFLSWPSLGMSPSDFIDFAPLQSASSFKKIVPAISAFVFIGIFDVSGVMFGVASLADLILDDGSIPGSFWGFIAAGGGTLLASTMGCSPIIVTVECAAGIKEGGRTGLTAVVVGILFLLSLVFAPLLGSVPQPATAPVLMLVGTMMMGSSKNIDWDTMSSAIPAFLTIVMMPLTYSITNGIMFGIVTALCFYITTGDLFRDVAEYFCREKIGVEVGYGNQDRHGLIGDRGPSPTPSAKDDFGEAHAKIVRKPSFQLDKGDIAKMNRTGVERKAEGGESGYGSVSIA